MSLFVHTGNTSIIYVLIYVDDIIITSSNDFVVKDIIQRLHKEFAITDLGSLSFFLGIEAIRDATGLFLTQRRCIVDLLTKSKMDGAKPCSTPMSTSVTLTTTDTATFDDPTLYRSIVGDLHYLSFTRPDIAFIVHRVSKFMHQPKQPTGYVLKEFCVISNTPSHTAYCCLATTPHFRRSLMQIG